MTENSPAVDRLSNAWNRVHQLLLEQSGPAITTPTPSMHQVFFVAGDHCLTTKHDSDEIDDLTDRAIDEALRFDQVARMPPGAQERLAADLESWLEQPQVIQIDEPVDLFKRYMDFPLEVRAITDRLTQELEIHDPYAVCRDYLAQLEPLGYTFEYGLDGEPCNLQRTDTLSVTPTSPTADTESLAPTADEDDDQGMAPR